MFRRSIAGLALFVCLAACGPKATPVTPQPVDAEEQARLDVALRGTWQETAAKVGDGKLSPDNSVRFTFTPGGSYRHEILTPMGTVDQTYHYRLEGKNLITNSPHGTYRIEDVSGDMLTLFNYDASTTWYLQRAK